MAELILYVWRSEKFMTQTLALTYQCKWSCQQSYKYRLFIYAYFNIYFLYLMHGYLFRKKKKTYLGNVWSIVAYNDKLMDSEHVYNSH